MLGAGGRGSLGGQRRGILGLPMPLGWGPGPPGAFLIRSVGPCGPPCFATASSPTRTPPCLNIVPAPTPQALDCLPSSLPQVSASSTEFQGHSSVPGPGQRHPSGPSLYPVDKATARVPSPQQMPHTEPDSRPHACFCACLRRDLPAMPSGYWDAPPIPHWRASQALKGMGQMDNVASAW